MILRTTIIFTYNQDLNLSTPNQNFTFIGWFDQEGVNISLRFLLLEIKISLLNLRKGITQLIKYFLNSHQPGARF